MHASMASHFDPVRLFAVLWTVALWTVAPLSMGFSRQENGSGLPCPPPGALPDSGIKPASPVAPALQVDSLLLSHQGSPSVHWWYVLTHLENFLKIRATHRWIHT